VKKTYEFVVHLVLLLGFCHRLKPRQSSPVLFGKLLSTSGKELSKEFLDGHWPKEIASHFVVHIVAQLFYGRFIDGGESPCAVAGVFGG